MISLIKLTDGTEIIGNVLEETKNEVVVDNPLQINYTIKNHANPPVISLQRFMPFSGTTISKFKQEHVISKVAPLSNMIKYYDTSLKGIQSHVDPALDQELAIASGDDSLSLESEAKLAMLEKHATKATLN